MKLVIDIPEKIYKHIISQKLPCQQLPYGLSDMIKNGTPLPKGHGRLFDERDIVDGSYEIIGNRIYELEPIIGADIS